MQIQNSIILCNIFTDKYMANPRIVIADSSFLVREGLKNVIANQYNVIAEAENYPELKSIIAEKTFDILIIDPSCPSFEIFNLINFKIQKPKVQILVISDIKLKNTILNYTENNINHIITKGCNAEEIITCLEKITKGEKFFCGSILDIILKNNIEEAEVLSDREKEVIILVAEGYTTNQIADKLFLSTHTINAHRKNIIKKLGFTHPADLTKYAIYRGYIIPDKFC